VVTSSGPVKIKGKDQQDRLDSFSASALKQMFYLPQDTHPFPAQPRKAVFAENLALEKSPSFSPSTAAITGKRFYNLRLSGFSYTSSGAQKGCSTGGRVCPAFDGIDRRFDKAKLSFTGAAASLGRLLENRHALKDQTEGVKKKVAAKQVPNVNIGQQHEYSAGSGSPLLPSRVLARNVMLHVLPY
jgi:hypothetical protein